MMTWLITGGAGYIGAHVVRAMRADGHGIVVLDDLSIGRREPLAAGVPLVPGSTLDGTPAREPRRPGDPGAGGPPAS